MMSNLMKQVVKKATPRSMRNRRDDRGDIAVAGASFLGALVFFSAIVSVKFL